MLSKAYLTHVQMQENFCFIQDCLDGMKNCFNLYVESCYVCSVLEAVCFRLKVDTDRFEDIFRTCLRRTLGQMLCDVRRDRKRAGRTNVSRREKNGSHQLLAFGLDDQGSDSVSASVLHSSTRQMHQNVLAWKSRYVESSNNICWWL